MPVRFTIVPEINPDADKAGTHSLFIRITAKGKRLRLPTGIRIRLKDWNQERGLVKNSHTHAVALNAMIRKHVGSLESWIISEQAKGAILSLSYIKNNYGKQKSGSLSEFITGIIAKGKVGPGTLRNWECEKNRLEKFDPGIQLSAINHTWLSRYEASLKVSENTRHKCFKILSRFLNAAVKEGLIDKHPMTGFDRPKYRQSSRVYLTRQEVEEFEKALSKPLPDYLYNAGAYFLLGCYSGLRVSDWLRFNKSWIENGRLILRAKKNGELVSMKLYKQLQAAIDRVIQVGACHSEQKTRDYIKAVAKIAGIKKHISTHTARHSFAIRCAEAGLSIESTAELMGINVKTCEYYYKVTGKKLDADVDKLERAG